MERYVSLLLCIVLSTTAAPDGYPRDTKQYRSDYEYNRKTDAFYKLHIESRHRTVIKDVCSTEGAVLMVPRTHEDIFQAHAMFKKFPDLGDYIWVADDGQNHDSAEETPIINLNEENEKDLPASSPCDVLTRDGDVKSVMCYRALPFICKVNAKDAPYDPHCKVYAEGYKYYATVGSCYKMPRIAYSWSEAYAECEAEGAHLVVLNSETEREIVQNITQTEPKVPNCQASWFFHAGFRSLPPPAPLEFKTIFNQTLAEAGFSQWSPNEPNNADNKEFCGTIFKNNGLLNDVECACLYAFICEKEITYV